MLLITGHRKRVVGLGRGIDLSLWYLVCTACCVLCTGLMGRPWTAQPVLPGKNCVACLPILTPAEILSQVFS